jgi:membrane-associated phospholipid phosphatase
VLDLHVHPPMTLARVRERLGWLLPLVIGLFLTLAIGARLNVLEWDAPITNAVVAARTSGGDRVAMAVSRLGSTPVVLAVSVLAALAAWRRCPRLALAIVIVALARPLSEFLLKELISRDRPVGNRLVGGRGPSFPSGHPYAAAASWGMLPFVVALYTRRRVVWWSTVVVVWLAALCVAASRVWLGVHWTSDVVAGLLLAVIGVSFAERFLAPCRPCAQRARDAEHPAHADDADDADHADHADHAEHWEHAEQVGRAERCC